MKSIGRVLAGAAMVGVGCLLLLVVPMAATAQSQTTALSNFILNPDSLADNAITITSPAAGEIWRLGSTQTISWTYKGTPPGPDVKIILSSMSRPEHTTLVEKTSIGSGGKGSFTWKIPSMNVGTDYYININCGNFSYYGQTNGNFTIAMPSQKINITSPKGGELFDPGTTQTIRWTYTGDIGSEVAIRIRATRSDGLYYDKLYYGIKVMPGGNGSWNWVLPSAGQAFDATYNIIVFSTANTDIAGTSQGFRIKGPYQTFDEAATMPITLTSPKAGDTWMMGSTQTIKWTYRYDPPGPNAKIILLYNKLPVQTISPSTSMGSNKQGSYYWQVPILPEGAAYTIRIETTATDNFIGVSSSFSISKPKPTLTITSPKTGDTLKEGTTQTIQWAYSNATLASVNIAILYKGSTVAVIAKDLPATPGGNGSYNWVIPRLASPPGGDYSIQIVAYPYAGGPIESRSGIFNYAITQPKGTPPALKK